MKAIEAVSHLMSELNYKELWIYEGSSWAEVRGKRITFTPAYSKFCLIEVWETDHPTSIVMSWDSLIGRYTIDLVHPNSFDKILQCVIDAEEAWSRRMRHGAGYAQYTPSG